MKGVTKITMTEAVSLVFFERLPADGKSISLLLKTLAQEHVNIDMISQSTPCAQTVALSFTISDSDLVKTLRICNELSRESGGLKPLVSSSNCKIQIYGTEMAELPGVAAAAISALYDSGIEILLITTSEIDISCLVARMDVAAATKELYKTFAL